MDHICEVKEQKEPRMTPGGSCAIHQDTEIREEYKTGLGRKDEKISILHLLQ